MALSRLPQAEELLSGKISGFLTAVATTMTVDTPPDASKLPTYLKLEPNSDNKETVRVTGVSGNVCTIERGVYTGGVGTTHGDQSSYEQVLGERSWTALARAVETGWLVEDTANAFARVDTDTFTITGHDATAYYTVGRWVRINGSVYTKVASSSFGANVTTVNTADATVPTPITSLEIAIQPTGNTNPAISVTEANITLSDNTTNDVSTTKHGFAPKAPNDTTKFLRGDGTYATPTSGITTQNATITTTSSTPGTTWTDITGATVTINPSVASTVILQAALSVRKANAGGRIDIRLLKDGVTELASGISQNGSAGLFLEHPVFCIDAATAGSHTYKLQYSDQLAAGGVITIEGGNFSTFGAVVFS